MENILEVKNLTKKFKKFVAVDDISFSLREGEILGLLGKNGAGKTTAIQMMLGVLTPTSGDVFYFGKNLKNHREEILERVNFSSAYINPPLDLTVKENLTAISYLYNIKNRKKRIAELVKIFQLEEIFNQQVKEISSGQLTKVNLAKAFINYPSVLLLDEPTASLDPEVANYIRKIIIREQRQFNVSTIITSHNMAEVEEICDRIIFIDDGKIIADDTPENLSRTIKVSHVRLLIRDKLPEAENFCQAQKLSFITDGNCLIVDLFDDKIPEFLRGISAKNIDYDEISIDRPTLEDYFLETISKKNEVS